MEKWCKTCATWRSVDSFYLHRTNHDGLDSTCKECRKRRIGERQRERYREDPLFRQWCRNKKSRWLTSRRGGAAPPPPSLRMTAVAPDLGQHHVLRPSLAAARRSV